MSEADRPVVIVAATPTSNGTMHVGHVAGPYLAADICARHLQSTGRPVLSITCTDDSQSYVLTTAHRKGVTPQELSRMSTRQIEDSLTAMGAFAPGLPPIDDHYRASVVRFVSELYDTGRLRLRTVALPYAVRAGRFLYDGLLSGTCQTCSAPTAGGACENCGHPVPVGGPLGARYSLDPDDDVEHRDHAILVLPLEELRTELTAFYRERTPHWRPRSRALIEELLAGALPDVPITVPGDWGIPAPFPETAGQILYPWIEAMPAVMYSTWWSGRRAGQNVEGRDDHWLARRDPQIVFFHGFDNTFHWSMVDVALLLAHGDRFAVPEATVCNEFYLLAGEKFSTSRNHLITATSLFARVPRDAVRFYLSLTAPESRQTNFTEDELLRAVTELLVGPWNELAGTLARLPGPTVGQAIPLTPAGRVEANALTAQFRSHYELTRFSPSRVAGLISAQLSRLGPLARAAWDGGDPAAIGDLLLLLRTVLTFAAPILIDVTQQLSAQGVLLDASLRQTTAGVSTIPAFRLPFLADVGAGVTHSPEGSTR